MIHPFSTILAHTERGPAVLLAGDYQLGKNLARSGQPFSTTFLTATFFVELERQEAANLNALVLALQPTLPRRQPYFLEGGDYAGAFDKKIIRETIPPFQSLEDRGFETEGYTLTDLNLQEMMGRYKAAELTPIKPEQPQGAVVYAQGFVDGVAEVVEEHRIPAEQMLGALEKLVGFKNVQSMISTVAGLKAYSEGVQLKARGDVSLDALSHYGGGFSRLRSGMEQLGLKEIDEANLTAYKLGFAVAIATQYGVTLKQTEVPTSAAMHEAFMAGLRGESRNYEGPTWPGPSKKDRLGPCQTRSYGAKEDFSHPLSLMSDLEILRTVTRYAQAAAYKAGKRVHDEKTKSPPAEIKEIDTGDAVGYKDMLGEGGSINFGGEGKKTDPFDTLKSYTKHPDFDGGNENK